MRALDIFRHVGLAAALGLATLLAACGARTEPGVRVLTYASPYPPGHTFSRADQVWMRYVETESGGRLKIQPFWSGSLLSADQSVLELAHGVADIGMITPIYSRSAHLQRLQPAFYSGVGTISDQVDIYKCLAAEFPQLNNELRGVRVLAVQGGNYPGILTRNRPVTQLSDLRGLRLRAQTDAADILTGLGADPVNMPMGEVYSAMAKGVIDGVVTPPDALRNMHFAEVARYFTQIRFARGAYPARAISERSWRRLPPDLQAVLTRAQPVWEAALTREISGALASGVNYAHKAGIEFVPLKPGEQAAFDALYSANAARLAKSLDEVGIDGEPVLRRTWQLIGERNAGQPLPCATSGPRP